MTRKSPGRQKKRKTYVTSLQNILELKHLKPHFTKFTRTFGKLLSHCVLLWLCCPQIKHTTGGVCPGTGPNLFQGRVPFVPWDGSCLSWTPSRPKCLCRANPLCLPTISWNLKNDGSLLLSPSLRLASPVRIHQFLRKAVNGKSPLRAGSSTVHVCEYLLFPLCRDQTSSIIGVCDS